MTPSIFLYKNSYNLLKKKVKVEEIILKKIMRKMSGVLLVFALILVWAFFSYSENSSTMQASAGVISRD